MVLASSPLSLNFETICNIACDNLDEGMVVVMENYLCFEWRLSEDVTNLGGLIDDVHVVGKITKSIALEQGEQNS